MAEDDEELTTKSKVEQIIDRRQVRLPFHSVTRKVSGGLQYTEAASLVLEFRYSLLDGLAP